MSDIVVNRHLPFGPAPEWLRITALAAFAGSFLAAAGAFDTDAAATLPRLSYWLIMSLVSVAALEICHRLIGRRTPGPEWRRRAIGLLLLFLPLTLLALIWCKIMFGGAPDLRSFYQLLPGMTGILIALQLVLSSFAAAKTSARELPRGPVHEQGGLDFLPLPLRGARIDALEAQDHYVRVHSSAGQALVRIRFKDAVQGVSHIDGLRPHRSWWVARESITAMARTEGRLTLTLPGGRQVPVSKAVARTLGPAFTLLR